jgi:O-antigen/teichoic acid export membrane protein
MLPRGEGASLQPAEDIPEQVDTMAVGTRVTRNDALSLLRLALGQVVGLAALVVLTNELAPAGYALYGAMAAAGPAAFVLVTGSIGTTLVRQRAPLAPGQVAAATTVAASWLALGALVSAGAGALLGQPLVGIAFGAYLLLLVPCVPAWVSLNRRLRSAAVAFIDLADRVGLQLGAATLAFATTLAATSVVAVAVVVSGIAASATALLASRAVPRFGRPSSLGVSRGDLTAAFLLTLSSVALDVALIPVAAAAASPTDAGYFAWAMSLMVVPLGFAAIAYQVLLPGFSRTDDTSLASAVAQSTRLVFALGVLLTVPLVAGAPSTLTWLFPQRWEASLGALCVLGAAGIVYATTLPMLAAWTARGDLPGIARAQLATSGIALVLAAALGMPYGATGIAVGLLAGRTCMLLAARRALVGLGLGAPGLPMIATGAVLAPLAGYATGHVLQQLVHDGLPATLLAVAAALPVAAVVVALACGRHARTDLRMAWTLLTGRGA